MDRLKGKTVVFVGGGSAVASTALKIFLEEGANMVLVDIDEKYFERTKELRAAYGESRVKTFIGACTSKDDMKAAMAFAVNAFGSLDVLVNIAGFHGQGHAEEIVETQFNLAMDVTCSGAYRAIMEAVPYMKKQGGGHIINFTSLGGRGNRGVSVSYAASKAACTAMAKALAMELAPFNINVTSFAPGTLDTKAYERIPEKGSLPWKMPPGGIPGMPGYKGPAIYNGQSVIKDRPIANLDEIAYALVFLSCDESRFITGDCLDMNGGILMQ